MNLAFGFLSSFGVTLALLIGVVYTGFKARRRVHLPLVAATVVALCVTIFFAERLGHELDLESAGVITPIHLTLAKLATLSFLLPLITGVRTLRNPGNRRLHRIAAFTALTLTVAAAGTGTAMWLLADPLPASPGPISAPEPAPSSILDAPALEPQPIEAVAPLD